MTLGERDECAAVAEPLLRRIDRDVLELEDSSEDRITRTPTTLPPESPTQTSPAAMSDS